MKLYGFASAPNPRNTHPMFAGPAQMPALADQARGELPGVLAAAVR